MPHFNFARGQWDPAALPMTYAPMCRDRVGVTQEDDCISAGYNEALGDYDYIGVAMAEPVTGDRVIRATCAFGGLGAPLLVLADGVHVDAEGRRMYDAIHEIVAYAGGCNVWRITPEVDPADSARGYTVRKLAGESFAVAEGSMVELCVRVRGKVLDVTLNGYAFTVDVPDLPARYYVGATLCEGENRFYTLSVE